MPLPPLLQATGLRRVVPQGDRPRVLFDGLELALQAGERVHLSAPSGAGKSSLLRCLVGLDPLDAGTLLLDGTPVAARGGPALRARVAYVPQTPRVRAATVAAYLDEPWSYAVHRGRQPDRGERDRLLEVLGFAPGQLEVATDGLSGGERKRLALLRALWLGPCALLLDEPSAGLDPARIAAVLAELHRFADAGGAVVVVSHDLDQSQLRPSVRWRLTPPSLQVQRVETGAP